LVVAAELRPGAKAARLRHEAFKRHIRSASQRLEIRSGRYQKLRRSTIVVRLGEDVERVSMDVVRHVLAHDQRVSEGAEIGLEIGDRTPALGVSQMKL